MSRHERPRDVLWLLGAIHHWTRAEVRGEHGGPERTAFSRIVVVTLALLLAGSTLWTTFKASLPTILVIVAVVAGVKLLRRFLRR